MRRERNAKIVATLGPVSSTPEMIHALFHRGVDVFRLNFSHGTQADHKERMQAIRAVEAMAGRPIGVLMDLQGPKLRIGTFSRGPVMLAEGDSLRLDLDSKPGNAKRVCLPHPEVFAVLKPGLPLLIDDGKLRLEVERTGDGYALTRVKVGGKLSERKGVNIPDEIIPLSPLTAKDRRDLEYGLELGADWVALSFVQRPDDIDEARALIGDSAGIMAKLEKPMAINKLDAIVAKADSIMVARGDLGVEMRPEQVPTVQRRILRECRRAGKPVVVATQMLESMITAPVPTRAEASDVATAVYDGADAVMLSAESASGAHPLEAVAIMDRIIREVEHDDHYRVLTDAQHSDPQSTAADAIMHSLRAAAHIVSATATVIYTHSGSSSVRASRERPEAPLLSLTPKLSTARRLALVWGVHSVLTHEISDVDTMTELACQTALGEGFAKPGDSIVIAAGVPFGRAGTTNMLRLATVWAPSKEKKRARKVNG